MTNSTNNYTVQFSERFVPSLLQDKRKFFLYKENMYLKKASTKSTSVYVIDTANYMFIGGILRLVNQYVF